MTYDVLTPSAARLWDYGPDWSRGYEFTRSFKTDIITSRNGTEQRRALRDVPRLSMRYATMLREGAGNHFLRAWQNKPAAIPDYGRHALTTAAASGGNTSITVASPWIAEGQILVLCGAVHEMVVVDGVSGSTVSLTGALSNAWPSGSVVRPGIFGLLSGSLNASRLRRGAKELQVGFAAYPGGEPPEDEGTASDTFNGYEVLTAEPDWSASPGIEHIWPVEQIDFGYGRTAQFRPIERAETVTEAEYSGLSRAGAQAIEQTFLRAKGRRGAFYRPTTEKDFTLAATATSGTSTFLAAGTDIATDFGSLDFDEQPEAIEVVKVDGTRIRRLITGISSTGVNSQITVNSPWPSDLTAANVARISWMPLVRFASDDLTTLWRTPLSATIRASFQSVKA